MLRRLRRIYPPLLLSIIICIATGYSLRALGLDQYSGPATPYRTSFSYLDYLPEIAKSIASFGFRGSLHGSSNGPLWSLVIEMQAYVFAGLIAQAIVARSTLVRIVTLVAIVVAVRARGLQWPADYELTGFACFAAGAAASLAGTRLPRLVPSIQFECSYSLYIFHFPVFLAAFFLLCQGEPSLLRITIAAVAGLAAMLGLSIVSGLFVEPFRGWRRRSLSAA
jgi:peptidoglycan/LPS O-acetylase OafA/YrhL